MDKSYIVVDNYEEYGFVGEYNTLNDAKHAVADWIRATDGKCNCEIVPDVWDEKRQYVDELSVYHLDVLKAINPNVTDVCYRGEYGYPEERIFIGFKGGKEKKINVTGDSLSAMLKDIIKAIE